MNILTKEIFVLAIKSLEHQLKTDKMNAEIIQTVFLTDDFGFYDNLLLIKTITCSEKRSGNIAMK
jgi:hypothetical protein